MSKQAGPSGAPQTLPSPAPPYPTCTVDHHADIDELRERLEALEKPSGLTRVAQNYPVRSSVAAALPAAVVFGYFANELNLVLFGTELPAGIDTGVGALIVAAAAWIAGRFVEPKG